MNKPKFGSRRHFYRNRESYIACVLLIVSIIYVILSNYIYSDSVNFLYLVFSIFLMQSKFKNQK